VTQPLQDKAIDLPFPAPDVDRVMPPEGASRVSPPAIPARRGLETDDASSMRRHLTKRVRRHEPPRDGA